MIWSLCTSFKITNKYTHGINAAIWLTMLQYLIVLYFNSVNFLFKVTCSLFQNIKINDKCLLFQFFSRRLKFSLKWPQPSSPPKYMHNIFCAQIVAYTFLCNLQRRSERFTTGTERMAWPAGEGEEGVDTTTSTWAEDSPASIRSTSETQKKCSRSFSVEGILLLLSLVKYIERCW